MERENTPKRTREKKNNKKHLPNPTNQPTPFFWGCSSRSLTRVMGVSPQTHGPVLLRWLNKRRKTEDPYLCTLQVGSLLRPIRSAPFQHRLAD